jgi:hypothetical protein
VDIALRADRELADFADEFISDRKSEQVASHSSA